MTIHRTKQRTLAAAAAEVNGNGKHLNSAAPAPLAGDPLAPDDEVLRISLAMIVASPHNWRKTFDEGKLEELAASIKAQGVLVPLIVREAPNRGARPAYELVDGERRLRAARMAGLAVVPAILRKLTDVQALEAIIASAEQREDIPALEKADGYHALTKLGVSPEQIAAKVGKSPSTIHGLLKLRNLPEPARKALAAGVLPVETAKLIARVPVEATRAKVALHVLADETWWDSNPRPAKDREPMTYRRAREFIANRCLTELKKAPFDPDGPALIPGATSCDICPKRAGNARKIDPEGFQGVRDDMCTDPECFRAKSAAWVEQQAAEAKAEGLQVLPKTESAQVFNDWGTELTWQGKEKYVDLAAKCYEDPKQRTYRAILGKQPEGRVVAFDHLGKRRELLPKAEAAAALKKAGVKAATRVTSPGAAKEDKRRREKAMFDGKVERAMLAEFVEKVEGAFSHLTDRPQVIEVLRALVVQSLNWSYARDAVYTRREARGDGVVGRMNAIKKQAGQLSAVELIGLISEFQLGSAVLRPDGAEEKELAKALGLSTRAEVEKRLKAVTAK